ncbi:5637_t:CDS:10 [Scutellospora calospora]|uniref:5637_t:CDS:1 n=1 Tax=Scutellospora calospora TaxID=85575 RepID=A0ACA9K1S7_9GLOM|nr:5637_t:CDS:10 [Scutellospora calospora]
MKHLAAYLLLNLAGKDNPKAKDIKALLDSVGIETDDERIKTLLSELDGKNINELIAEGSSKLSSVPSGGGGVSASAAGGGGAGGGAAEAAPVEEAKEEEKEESDELIVIIKTMGERYKQVIPKLTWTNSTNDSGISSNLSDFTFCHFGSSSTKAPQMGGRHDLGHYVKKHQLNNPLIALSSSPDSNQVIVAGSSGISNKQTYISKFLLLITSCFPSIENTVLKILNVSDREITEESNLNVRHGNKNSNITDVKWGNSSTRNKVATAATTGSISIWDVGNGQPRDEQKINAHDRAVNRVCFNPKQGDLLLSASHDGTMKLWDLREYCSRPMMTFDGKCESVRDVQFNPASMNEFVAAFENGTIQKWDLKKPNLNDRKLNAHIGPVLAIDWHSDGRTVASGGRDKAIKIWDMCSSSIRPKGTIYTMSSVARVQWRPNNQSEIASCSLQGDNRIFVWNIKRPYIASCFFEEHSDVPTGFLWHDSDVLWSCSKDKFFVQQDIRYSYHQLDLLSKCAIGWSVYDQIAFAIEKSNDTHSEDQNRSMPSSSQFRLMQRRTSPGVIEPRNEDNYQLQQKTGSVSLPTFDPKSFSYLAINYISSGSDIWDMCDHNAKVAWDVQRYRTAQTWKVVQLLYGKKTLSEMNKAESNIKDKEMPEEPPLKNLSSATHSKSPSEAKDNDFLKDNSNAIDKPINPDDDSTSDPESEPPSEYEPDHYEKPYSNQIVQPEFKSTSWDKEPIMSQLLDYYAEQGDVQMCVTLILVLGDKLKINEERVEQWFFSYVDLLHRFQLWCAATFVIKYCNNTTVGILNQQSTLINTTCINCFKPINDTMCEYWLCARCKKLILCSLCHVTVKGLYTWCQGCSHGGHHSHMQDWFSCNEECPTGCGHKCLTFLV